jgi:hypothetical protein
MRNILRAVCALTRLTWAQASKGDGHWSDAASKDGFRLAA